MYAKIGVMLLWMLCMVTVMAATVDAKQKREARRQHNSHVTAARQKRNVGGSVSSLQNLMNAVERDDHMAITEQYMNYTPSTPAPENINCWVEVPTTRLVGGRCVRMGQRDRGSARNRPWACQAGLHLAILSPDCPNRLRGRSSRRRNRRD